MMSLVYIFWMYVILFGIIGMLRGWAKEMLVAFSVVVALTLNHVLRKYVPVVQLLPAESPSLIWVLSLVLVALVFFGYQTVALIPHLQAKATGAVPDLVVNTSCEHLADFAAWYGKIPPGQLLALQSNDYVAIAEHVGAAPQSDDLTMLGVRYLGKS